jgi:hypothetical protein
MHSNPVTALPITPKNQYASDSELVNEVFYEYVRDSHGGVLDVVKIERTETMTPTHARRYIIAALDDLNKAAVIIPVLREKDITTAFEKFKVIFTGEEITKMNQGHYTEDLVIHKIEAIVGFGKVESVLNFKLPAKLKSDATVTESVEVEVTAEIVTAKEDAKLGNFFVAVTVYHD